MDRNDRGSRDRGDRRDRGGDRDFGGNRGGGYGGGSRGGFSQGPREMHKAKCSKCGQDCEVPFKPKEDRPVYCKECYRSMKDTSAAY